MVAMPVTAKTQKITFEGPVRLQQALSAMQEQGLLENTYWPTARLIKVDDQSQIDAQKRAVLGNLAELEDYWRGRRETDKADAAALVANQIKRWRLGKQLIGAVSIEQARQRLANNPLLPEGKFQLVVSDRPEVTYAYGLFAEPGQYEFHSGKTVANWIHSIGNNSALLAAHNKTQAVKVSVAVSWKVTGVTFSRMRQSCYLVIFCG